AVSVAEGNMCGNHHREAPSTAPDPSTLFAQVGHADTHLDDPGFVHAPNAHVFENLVVDFALACSLDHNILAAVDQRPERGRLGLLYRIRAEREIDPGI